MMNRRMIKILALGALMLALPAVALAQTSRVEGMALQGDFVKDMSGMFTYTSQVANVGNVVYGELGNTNSPPVTSDRSVGAVIGNLWDGRYGTWAIHLHEQTPNLGQGTAGSNPAPGFLGFDPNTNTHDSFDIMWGKKFGTTSFGLRVQRAYTDMEGDLYTVLGPSTLAKIAGDATSVAALNTARNILGLGAGAGFEMSPTSNVELAFLYQSRTFEASDSAGTVGGVKVAEDSPTSYQLAARGMWQWTSNVMVVPVFKWYNYDLGVQTTPGTTSKASLSGWQIGAAGNWTLGANDLFVLGVNFASNKLEDVGGGLMLPFGGEIKETIMPELFAALEAHLNSWLTLRFGAKNGAMTKIEVQDNTTPTTVTFRGSDFTMSLGAGAKFGPLQLDAVVDDSFPHVGPWFVSGQSASGPVFPKVTATYPF
jgi:hypothetical protein